MYSFENDYSEGACKQVLDYLIEHNDIQSSGYGLDEYCNQASLLIKKEIARDDVDIHFITGGTPCNVLAINLLKPYEAVICVESGHINVHETGAVEATGHKIIPTKGKDGKILIEEIEKVILSHQDEHMVKPRMVFISNATEYGTIYTKQELIDIADVCKKYNLYLYLDGARIGNALMAKNNDLDLKTIAQYVDIFYIGGTKNGALLGEAMVIISNDLKENFRYYMKRNCAMLAKSKIIGQQFISLFTDSIYYKNAANANQMAQALKDIFLQNNIEMYIDSPTNQIFPIIENELLKKIKQEYQILEWGPYDDQHTIVRFVCSWATKEDIIDKFKNDLILLKQA